MTYSIDSDENGRFFVEMELEPDFIVGLPMAPAEREQQLNEGDWIVLSFAIWNSHDRPAIDIAMEAVKAMDGRVHLGIRPFEVAEEFSVWCPYQPPNTELVVQQNEQAEHIIIAIRAASGNTPVWLFLRDGMIVQSHLGPLLVEELHEIIEKRLRCR